MSFSSEVKAELAALPAENECCRASLAYGLLECGHAFTQEAISLQTEHEPVADLYRRAVSDVCTLAPGLWEERRRGNGGFSLAVGDIAARRRVLERFGHSAGEVALRLNRAVFECEACPTCYLRGAFLACGAVTDPKADYHMEFSTPFYNLSRDLEALVAELGLKAGRIRRKGGYVVYIKDSEQIEDCLTLMGATAASLEMMNVQIVKDIRNNANRVTNCESANIDKTVAAAAVQVQAVQRIARHGGLGSLPDDLREIAQLRLDNPEMSLRELGEAMRPPLSRSGVNHRLRRLLAYADTL